ncbi:hypothetical protein LTR53_005580 [Teratosphaeriaceae sp. CCFEE 6253]|nr:hypothetical protein LTR53_005580 [Teratosphaeriaceae sp. CCFEE 6253]
MDTGVADPVSLSPTVSGTTATPPSSYDEKAACEKSSTGTLKHSLAGLPGLSVTNEEGYDVKWRVSLQNSCLQIIAVEDNAVGYTLIANFQSSDRDFLLYRGFLHLRSRVLSALQADIARLEAELDRMDRWDLMSGLERRMKCLQDKSRDDLQSRMEKMPEDYLDRFTRTRPDLLRELNVKLVEYDGLLLKTRAVHTLQKPAQRDYQSVRNWFESKKPLIQEEMEYIRRKEDLVTLRDGRESASFDVLVERCVTGLDKFLSRWCRCKRLFVTEELRQKTDNGLIHYYAPHRVDILVNLIITAIIFILLVVPVVILYTGQNASTSPVEAIGILIVFTQLFGCTMSALTTAKRQELFAASAAYCAVLVVFVGNLGVQQVQIVPA